MTSELLIRNLDGYDIPEDPIYLLKPEQRRRSDIIVDYINGIAFGQLKQVNILSVACSSGYIESRLVQNGHAVFGVDGAFNALTLAHKRILQVSQVDLSKSFPFRSDFFDIVYAGEIIEHIFDTKCFLGEVNRVTRKGGSLVMSTPNLSAWDDRINMLFGKTPRQIAPLHPYLNLHIRPFTWDLLKESLSAYGYSRFDLQTNAVKFTLLGHEFAFYNSTLCRVLASVGSTLIVVATKE